MKRKRKSDEENKEEEEEQFEERLLELLLEVPLGWPTSEDSAGFDSGFRLRISWEFPSPGGAASHRFCSVPSLLHSGSPEDSPAVALTLFRAGWTLLWRTQTHFLVKLPRRKRS